MRKSSDPYRLFVDPQVETVQDYKLTHYTFLPNDKPKVSQSDWYGLEFVTCCYHGMLITLITLNY